MKYAASKTLLAAAALLSLGAAQADTGVFGSYLTVNGTVYTAQASGGAATGPAFNGANLGSFVEGGAAEITAAQLLTWKNWPSDVTGAAFSYSVDGGPAVSVNLGWQSDDPVDLLGNNHDSGSNQSWGGAITPINFLSGLAAGNHTLSVWLNSSTSDGSFYSNNGGANFNASFAVTAVPEPSSYALLLAGLGAVGFMSRRRSTR